jgi:hypothetical protein
VNTAVYLWSPVKTAVYFWSPVNTAVYFLSIEVNYLVAVQLIGSVCGTRFLIPMNIID